MLTLKNIFEQLKNGGRLLTVNRRLSRYLQTGYDNWQVSCGSLAWPTPLIIPFDVWLIQLSDTWGTELVLSELHELLIWERIIKEDRSLGTGFNHEAAARTASEAFRLQHAYRLKIGKGSSDESDAYLRWKIRFEAECDKTGSISRAILPDRVMSEKLFQNMDILLAGFDEITPQQSELFDYIRQHVNVDIVDCLEKDALNTYMYSFDNIESEVRSVAFWARDILLEKPASTLGIIIPAITEYGRLVKRVLLEVLSPAEMIAGSEETGLLNISLGGSLIDEGIIAAAIEILSCNPSNNRFDTVEYMLYSPYVSVSSEDLSSVESALRAGGNRLSSLSLLSRYAKGTRFAGKIDLLKSILAENRSLKIPAEWALVFTNCLKAMNWPEKRSLDSREYQAVNAWNKLMDSFSDTGALTGAIDKSTAVSLLRRMAGGQPFQPEGASSPVVVLGTLESAGITFDQVWIMGMDEITFPAPARPNPFIPYRLQQEASLPRSGPQRELEFAKILLDRLKRAAPVVHFSYAENIAGVPRYPSPLLDLTPSDYCKKNWNLFDLIHNAGFEQGVDNPNNLESIVDIYAPPVTGKTVSIKGGSEVIKNQSLCPFKAFAIHRLNCRETEQIPYMGLKGNERGSIIHKALELFWKKTAASRNLAAISSNEIMSRVDSAIEDAAMLLIKRNLPQEYINIEKNIILIIICELLDVELERIHFEIESLEQKKEIILGRMKLSVRADRIDRLDDGTLLLIDYKSGAGAKKQNLEEEERPREPQLQIYAADYDKKFMALIYAIIKTGESKFIGIGIDHLVEPRGSSFSINGYDKEAWEEKLKLWMNSLESIADEFMNGLAKVNPVNDACCTYCLVKPLCRIFE